MSNKGILQQMKEAGPPTRDSIHEKMRDSIFDTAVTKGQVGYLMVGGIVLGTDGSAVDMETGEPATVEQRMMADDILNKSLKP